jgi:hypothetical protein
MNTRQELIERLNKNTTLFKEIGGIAQLELIKNASVRFPAALVIPLNTESKSNRSLGGVMQHIIENFGIFIIVENRTDSLGNDCLDQINSLREEVMQILLNYIPDHACSGMTYDGGQLLDILDDLLIWQDTYNVYKHIQQLKKITDE